ncbi:MAG: hypothetical protein HFF83_07470 [Oscillibacter sp.]|jgi:hypothetical protein|nr:hypothetical protein [Oscillibacter sp.]
MKKTAILAKIGFKLKKHSPEILIIAGIVGTVASTVMACKATTKLSAIMDKTSEDIEAVHKAESTEELAEQYTPEDAKKDLTIIYAHTAWDLTKLYVPSVALGAISIASILTSHRIMVKRNLALAAAYVTIDKSFKEYRSRVVNRFGENVDRELRYNIKAKEIEETITDENGKKKKIKKTVDVAGPLDYSGYARHFDETSRFWEKNGDYNMAFLRAQQQRANDILRSRGFLFLNEVYRMLGLKETVAGQCVGWVYDRSESTVGDNYVDFNITEIEKEIQENPDEEPERVILLDFNVDGSIMNDFVRFDTTY